MRAMLGSLPEIDLLFVYHVDSISIDTDSEQELLIQKKSFDWYNVK